jgi:hypothetical protein
VLTTTAGFRHASIPAAQRALRELGRRSGAYDVRVTEGLGELAPARIGRYAAVVFALTSGELALSPAARAGLVRFVQRGGGFVGVHSAADTLYSYPPYGRMMGAYFRAHPSMRGTLTVTGPAHPATRGIPRVQPVAEELFEFRTDPRDAGARVILAVTPEGAGTPLPSAWCTPFGRGRVVYTALGHEPSLWSAGWFRRHLDGAIAWASGRREPMACR